MSSPNTEKIKVTHYHCDPKLNLIAVLTNNKKLYKRGKLKENAKVEYPTKADCHAYIHSSDIERLMAFPVEDLSKFKHPFSNRIKSYINYVETLENSTTMPEVVVYNTMEEYVLNEGAAALNE